VVAVVHNAQVFQAGNGPFVIVARVPPHLEDPPLAAAAGGSAPGKRVVFNVCEIVELAEKKKKE
jgi:hypothetical protein